MGCICLIFFLIVNVKNILRTELQETFVVQDCHFFNDGSTVTGLEIGSDVSCTSNGDYITITTSTSGEKDVKLPTTLTGDWEFETTLAELGNENYLTFKVDTGQQWGALGYDSVWTVDLGGGSSIKYVTVNTGDILKITYIDGTMSVYYNDTLLASRQVNVTGKIGYYTDRNRIQHIKDIKLKAL